MSFRAAQRREIFPRAKIFPFGRNDIRTSLPKIREGCGGSKQHLFEDNGRFEAIRERRA